MTAPRTLRIIQDTREQMPLLLPETTGGGDNPWQIEVVRATLPTGDYSIDGWAGRVFSGTQREPEGICIERKEDPDEIAGNFTTHRDRFERELERMARFKTKMLIIQAHPWQLPKISGMTANSFRASIYSLSEKFGVGVVWCLNRQQQAEYVANACRRFLCRMETEQRRLAKAAGYPLEKL